MTDMPAMPTEGDAAPAFTAPVHGWTAPEVTLSSLRGRSVVLYFYPRDLTPGCTTEALDFTAALPRLRAAGAEVFGISTDSLASHRRFADKHALQVPLIADAEAAIARAFGVWVEKNLYGKRSMGVERATFLIDPEGRIARIWRKVKVAGHVEAVLVAAEAR